MGKISGVSFYLPVTSFMQGVTLLILMAHMFFPISYEGLNLYWGSRLNKLKVLVSKLLLN